MRFYGLLFLKNTGNKKWNSSCCMVNFNLVHCIELTISHVTLPLVVGYKFIKH